MRKLLLIICLALAGAGWTWDSAHADPSFLFTETAQVSHFSGLEPSTQFLVVSYAYHYEGDPYPYTLGGDAYSTAGGSLTSWVSLGDLASHYNGADDGPVYETQVCIYADGTWGTGVPPLACSGDNYVGYYPESMWYYTGSATDILLRGVRYR
jgi:hypothetical protein